LGIAYVRLRQVQAVPTTADRIFVFAPLSIYFAWAAVATVANTTYFLYTASGLTPESTWLGISQPTWGAIMLIVAGIITTAVAVKYRDLVYMAVIVWAFGGIVARYPQVTEVALPAAGMALLGVLAVLAAMIFWREQRSMPRMAA
jgi:hypothetical protein